LDRQLLNGAFNAHKRIETLIHMLSVAEMRQRRRLLVLGIIRRERRSRRGRVHFKDNHRGAHQRKQLIFMRVVFLFILLTISTATALIAFHVHPRYAAPLMFIYQLLILTFVLVNPGRRQWGRSV
jgi:hypothetical protein